MPAVVLGGRAIVVALAALELLVLLLPVVRTPARREIGLLALQIVVPAVGVFLPPVAELRGAYLPPAALRRAGAPSCAPTASG